MCLYCRARLCVVLLFSIVFCLMIRLPPELILTSTLFPYTTLFRSRHQAEIGAASDYAALIHVTAAMNWPSTQLWLAHNAPAGASAVASARFPAPDWVPDGGWRVDKALVYAHKVGRAHV